MEIISVRPRLSPKNSHKKILQIEMSALPPKADMCGAARDVRYGPKADIVGKSTPSYVMVLGFLLATFGLFCLPDPRI